MKKIIKYGGFYTCVAAFFIMAVLNLTGVMHISWWWITAPLWIPVLAIIILLTILVYLAYGATEDENEFYY